MIRRLLWHVWLLRGDTWHTLRVWSDVHIGVTIISISIHGECAKLLTSTDDWVKTSFQAIRDLNHELLVTLFVSRHIVVWAEIFVKLIHFSIYQRTYLVSIVSYLVNKIDCLHGFCLLFLHFAHKISLFFIPLKLFCSLILLKILHIFLVSLLKLYLLLFHFLALLLKSYKFILCVANFFNFIFQHLLKILLLLIHSFWSLSNLTLFLNQLSL